MKTLFIGTNNDHKLMEIKEIFKLNNISFDIKCPKDFNITDEPVEDGNSFMDNAKIKSRFYYDKVHLPTIAEDSGICIDFYDGGPGIYSKRFLGNLNDRDKNEEILRQMKDCTNRKAIFHTFISYIDEDGVNSIFEGVNKGEIALEQAGCEGFGYDPIFYIPKEHKTEAELGQDWKNKNSHRAKAFKMFIDYMRLYKHYND